MFIKSLAQNVLQQHIRKHVTDPLEIAFADMKKNASTIAPVVDGIKWDKMQPRYRQEATKLLGDVFPDIPHNSIQLKVQWKDKWDAICGQNLVPNHSTFSPKVEIVRGSGIYSILFTDLDRPNIDEGVYEECVNIPISGNLEIAPGSSPFLDKLELNSQYASQPPDSPKLPGDVIFDYIPLHPAHSNPKSSRRYLFTVMKQKDFIDPKSLKEKFASEAKERSRAVEKAKAAFDADFRNKRLMADDPLLMRHERLESAARSCVGPTWKYVNEMGWSVAGFGFVRSSWNIFTPKIFKGLGIHEPVYGKLPSTQPKIFVDRMLQAVKHLKTANADEGIESSIINSADMPSPLVLTRNGMSQGPVLTKLVDLVNQGAPSQVPRAAKPSRNAEKILQKRDLQQAKLVNTWKLNKKVPKITTVGAVALVKSSEIDGAAKVAGPIVEKETRVRDRYRNV